MNNVNLTSYVGDIVLNNSGDSKVISDDIDINSYNSSVFGLNNKENHTEAKDEKTDNDSFLDIILEKISDFFKFIGDFFTFRTPPNTKDGKIESTHQGKTGDCWLLAGVNSLSYTKEGIEIIKDSLEYHDGFTLVNLKGVESVYKITDEEIEAAKNSEDYSRGDDDMIIFELAVEKALNEIASGEIKVNSSFTGGWSDFKVQELTRSSIWGGNVNELIYLLTGKIGNVYEDLESKNEALKMYQENGSQNITLGAGVHDENRQIEDIYGRTIDISGPHAFSVRDVNLDESVVVVNPNSSENLYTFDKDVFLNNFDILELCDISKDNPVKNIATRDYELDSNGNKNYIFDCSQLDLYDKQGNPVDVSKQIQTYDTDDVLLKITYYNSDNKPFLIREYNPDGTYNYKRGDE